MCGILGVRKSFRPARADAERALDALRWRGPDGARLIEVGGWWLGVARLRISDPAADQPIVCPRTGRAVALNGAITSAAADWERLGDRAQTRNDAELLLLRLEEGGLDAVTDVAGPYAWAIVDPRDDSVLLGRDPMGEKPLFVAFDTDRQVTAFASTASALLALGVGERPADRTVGEFLRFGFCHPEWPWRNGAPQVVDLPDPLSRVGRDGLAGTGPRPAASIAGGGPVADALRAAVARCATAEVPVAVALSGGMDSACIAACLKAAGRTVPAYQARAAGDPDDERDRARRVADHLALPFRAVDFDHTVLEALPALTRAVGLPLGDPSVFAVHALAKRAASDGVRVLLSGEGADELMLGYARHRAAAWLPRRGLAWLPSPALSTTRLARAWRAIAEPHPYDALLEVAPPGFRRRAFSGMPDVSLCRRALSGSPRLEHEGSLMRAREVDLTEYLRHDLLPKLDAATMAAGVEGRCPFLDPEVLRCRESVTDNLRSRLGKRPLRAAFEGALPPGHFEQRKRGFAVPLDRWWREDAFLSDLLLEQRTLQRPHLRKDGVRWLLDRHRAGRARIGHALYLLVAYEVYLRTLEDAP